jgi:hypothetical protein
VQGVDQPQPDEPEVEAVSEAETDQPENGGRRRGGGRRSR